MRGWTSWTAIIRLDGSLQLSDMLSLIHAQEDKFTQPSGDAGGEWLLGVIGIAKPLNSAWGRIKHPRS